MHCTIGIEGDERVARVESQEGHGDRCHADVLGFERFGVDLDSYRGDDLSGTDGGCQSFGRFLAHFNRHVYGDVRGAFGIVYQTANQYIRPGNSAFTVHTRIFNPLSLYSLRKSAIAI